MRSAKLFCPRPLKNNRDLTSQRSEIPFTVESTNTFETPSAWSLILLVDGFWATSAWFAIVWLSSVEVDDCPGHIICFQLVLSSRWTVYATFKRLKFNATSLLNKIRRCNNRRESLFASCEKTCKRRGSNVPMTFTMSFSANISVAQCYRLKDENKRLKFERSDIRPRKLN